MQDLNYLLLDVFTDRPFKGNPLAVVLYPEPPLSQAAMQAVAQEFNLSETVFVYKPEDAAHSAALRIFTAAFELPFAGHPTVGAAVALGILAQRRDGKARQLSTFQLEESIGLVTGELAMLAGGHGSATFVVPKLPVRYDHPLTTAAVARFLSLPVSALNADPVWGADIYSCGNPHLFIPLGSKEDVDRVQLEASLYEELAIRVESINRPPFIYVFSYDATSSEQVYARMLSSEAGIVEDPATGSAVAALAGYLFDRGPFASGSRSWQIRQGVAMGRASTLELTVEAEHHRLSKVHVAGQAVLVGEGRLLRPRPESI